MPCTRPRHDSHGPGESSHAHTIIGCAIKVHRALGPGLLESTCSKCTAYELRCAGCDVDEERPLPLVYGEVRLECGYRLDLVVNSLVIVEVKAVERLDPVHMAQLLTYLKLTGLPLEPAVGSELARDGRPCSDADSTQ